MSATAKETARNARRAGEIKPAAGAITGTYVMTSIACQYGNAKSWIGDDHANLFAAEADRAVPIKGANVIDVRPGEILDAGIPEIRSDKVGFLETKTASVVAASAPASEQEELRQAFGPAGGKLRFANFRPGVK
jgi:hypothetical protein